MKSRRGFTLVELFVALVFFGSLTAIAVPRYRLYKERAYVATMKADLGHLRIAEEAHWAERQLYSTDTASLDFRGSSEVRIDITSEDLIGGYTAVATHRLVSDVRCMTATGPEAGTQESGTIICRPSASGSGTLPTGNP
ncbi:MAG TPA: prepilin-type N-terminal cleavage/methylation domain-containing protein [Gemmatimonadaceae bacterium]|jgi:prepilin-type N-terminal cleavage/methylation domain-containing protein